MLQIQSVRTQHFIDNIISYAVPLSVSFNEIKTEALSDPDLCSTIQNFNTNFWDNFWAF